MKPDLSQLFTGWLTTTPTDDRVRAFSSQGRLSYVEEVLTGQVEVAIEGTPIDGQPGLPSTAVLPTGGSVRTMVLVAALLLLNRMR
jgi:hypothetical protein